MFHHHLKQVRNFLEGEQFVATRLTYWLLNRRKLNGAHHGHLTRSQYSNLDKANLYWKFCGPEKADRKSLLCIYGVTKNA